MSAIAEIFEELGFDRSRVRLPEGAVIYALARTHQLVMRRLASVYQLFGLTAVSFNLLVLLQRGRDPRTFTQQAIGERLVVSPSDMSGLVDRLERKGLVRREPGKDRRTNLLRLTKKGHQVVETAWPHHAREIQRLACCLKADDLRVLNRVLFAWRQAL